MHAFLLFPADIEDNAAQNYSNNCNNNEVLHRHSLLLHCVVPCELLVCIDAQICNHANNDSYSNQAGDETCAMSTGGDQSTNLINQECNHIASSELQCHTASEPLAVIDLGVHSTQGSKVRRREQV